MEASITKSSTNSNWFSVLYSSLFFAAFIILFISLVTSVNQPAKVSTLGYTILIIAFVLICSNIFINIRNKINAQQTHGIFSVLYLLLANLGPFILIISILMYSIYLFATYGDAINQGHTSSQYYTFSKMSTIMILIQIIIFISGMKSKQYTEQKLLPLVYNSAAYLVGVINAYIIIIMGFILSSYTTDG
jgi:hypothetical protein